MNLSDVAAMGAVARFALVSLGVPESMGAEDLERMYSGLEETLFAYGAVIVGGNTSACPGRLIVDVTLLGEVAEDRLLTRSGASVGDVLCVTGELGGSAAGLIYLDDPFETSSAEAMRRAIRRHLEPTPRMEQGRFLGAQGAVTACMDVSDGLLQDAGHMARSSGVEIRVDPAAVPVDFAAEELAGSKEKALELALTGGEDFELLFAVSEREHGRVLRELKEETGVAATPVGEIAGVCKGGRVTGAEGLNLAKRGFDHFG